MKDDIRTFIQAINERTENTIDDLRNLSALFKDGDEEADGLLIEAARGVLGEIFDISTIHSLNGKLITENLMNLLSYSSFVRKCVKLGAYSAKDSAGGTDYLLQVTEFTLADESRCIVLNIQKSQKEVPVYEK